MQRRNLSNAMRYLVAVCALVSALGLVGCGSDEGDTKNVIATVPIDGNTVLAVQNQPLTFSNGQGFGVNIGTGPFTLTFNSPNTFIVNPTGNPVFTGTVTYGSGGSCTFLAGGTTLSISTCNLVVNAQNVVVGGSQVGGTITFVLNNGSGATASSNSLNTTVFINDDGELFVINSTTGALVDTGIKP